jgi:hypothetical protein
MIFFGDGDMTYLCTLFGACEYWRGTIIVLSGIIFGIFLTILIVVSGNVKLVIGVR